MKLVIKKEIFVNNLEKVSRALSTRNIIPILNGIKLKLNKEGLYLIASDNEISIEIFIDKKNIISIESEGEIVISSGNKLLEIIKRLSNTNIIIESFEDNIIYFKTDNFEYKSNCFAVEEYPNIEFNSSEINFDLNSNTLKDMINKTVFACSLQESRPLLTGVNLKLNNNILTCTATDSYRLSKMQYITTEDNMTFNIVIPSRNINELNKVLNSDTNININIFNNKVLFMYDNIKFQTNLINSGTYPNTDNSIPKDFSNKIKVNIKDLISVVDRASLVAQFKEKNIIEMEIINNKLTIKASSMEIGKIEETIIVENITNNDIKISFSAKYMYDALKVFDGDSIYLLLNSDISPIIIREEKNDNLTELISPMKTF